MKAIVLVFIFIAQSAFSASGPDSSKQLQEVSIRAIRAGEKMMTTQTTIQPKQLEYINLGQDIPTLFQVLPSVSSGSDAGNGIGYSYMSIRGMDAQRIQVNINGVPYNDAESHEVYWVNIPDMLSSADDIQIQRGVGFSSLGGTGLGGTISIKTTKKYLDPFVHLGFHAGSFGTNRTVIMGSTGVMNQGWQLTARGSQINSNGFIDRASSRLISMYTALSKYGEKYTGHLIATHGRERTYQSWFGLSESDYHEGNLTKNIAGTDYEQKLGDPYPNQVDNYGQSHIQWLNNFYHNSRHSSSFTFFLSHGRGFFEEYKVGQEYSSYSPLLSGNGDLVRRLWLDNLLLGGNMSTIIEGEQWSNTTALSFLNYRGDHFGTLADIFGTYTGVIPNEYYKNNSSKTDFTAFNKLTYHLDHSNITLDLQIRRVSYEIIGHLEGNQSINLTKSFLFFNPKIGWNTELGKSAQVYAFAGINHREPNRSDFLVADSRYSPDPEKVYNFELGQRTKTKKLLFTTNFFMNYFQDQLIPTGALNSVGAPIRVNVPESIRTGIEAEFEYAFNNQLKFYTNQYLAVNTILEHTYFIPTYNADYTINESRSTNQVLQNTDIANSPNWISYMELRYSPWRNTSIQLMNKIVGSQYLDNTSNDLQSLPTYTFTNLGIQHKLIMKSKTLKDITLNLLLNNLFNTNYIPRGYTYHNGNNILPDNSIQSGGNSNFYFLQAGFHFMAGMQFGF